MKKDIHPKYYKDAKITCSCGAVLEVGSTQKEIEIEICSQCHPFYTGKKKVLDTTGRVDRFKKLAKKSVEKKAELKKSRAKKVKGEKVRVKKIKVKKAPATKSKKISKAKSEKKVKAKVKKSK